jgi:hypothetical protein
VVGANRTNEFNRGFAQATRRHGLIEALAPETDPIIRPMFGLTQLGQAIHVHRNINVG